MTTQIRSEDAPIYNNTSNIEREDEIIAQAQAILRARFDDKSNPITSPTGMKTFLQVTYAGRESELFGIILLDTRHRVIDTVEMFYGTIDGASVYPREVVKEALRQNAAAVVLFHNHPSGDTEPSNADRAITRRLNEALALVDVRVLDHLIVGLSGTTSFAERGLL